jgi:hypothetical protein
MSSLQFKIPHARSPKQQKSPKLMVKKTNLPGGFIKGYNYYQRKENGSGDGMP